MPRPQKQCLYRNAFITYDYDNDKFIYTPEVTDLFGDHFDDRPLWQIFENDDIASAGTGKLVKDTLTDLINDGTRTVADKELNMKADNDYKRINAIFLKNTYNNTVTILLSTVNRYPLSDKDELTGLLTKNAFIEELNDLMTVRPENESSKHIVVYLDVIRFKMINDIFGSKKGDELLKHVAEVINDTLKHYGFGCRIESDRFLFYTKCPENKINDFITDFLERVSNFDLSLEVMCNAGIYIMDKCVNAEGAVDRAIIAQKSIKGSYTRKFTIYKENLRNDLVTEQEISGLMKTALKEEQFVVYYQPQYNHTTGLIVGAEALIRWQHPERGLISPGVFIPIYEKNGFITKLDMYVFEKVCQFLRKCIEEGIHMIPVSINLTRYDIFSPDFIDNLEKIRMKYDVPSKYLRVEITESATLGNSDFINEAVRKLHSYGYIVEMDDFGSGYSSLNILKDIDFDMIKLDMKFLDEDKSSNKRGATILSSVVRMVNWLNLPVIAEGVETAEQADFLESIGCYYIQGFYYSKPLSEMDFRGLLKNSSTGIALTQMRSKENNAEVAFDFLTNDTAESLIFNNFVGGAAVFEYHNGNADVIRVNKKFLQEIGMNLTEHDLMAVDSWTYFDDDAKKIYIDVLENIIATGQEEECITWRTVKSDCCGEERILIRSTIQLLGKSGNNHLFYSRIKNITAQEMKYRELLNADQNFRRAFEQIDVYMWEYNIVTKDMFPCFRCQKNLGLPPVVKNYPDPVFESGLFPSDYADMYYDWMKQLEEGVEHIEGIIPLTEQRIPFMIRYTTEFDETGRPLKAYGSATRVVE
ncbi:MAG: bifunctional diguanylate cyclase/phosphodiesterase [Oscillospiraceae bacterium]|nr:bifunctional diguanylate cyclase/phosphodiesterase [Oscillospiraceae bacterium]